MAGEMRGVMIFGAADRPLSAATAVEDIEHCGAGGANLESLRYVDRLRRSLDRRRIGGGPLSPEAIAQAVAETQGAPVERRHRLFPPPAPAPLRQQDLRSPHRFSEPRRVMP